MKSTTTPYLTKSRHGIWYYQRWIPLHLQSKNTKLKKLFRKSLHTRNRRKATQLANRINVMFDDLITRFFNDPEDFGKAMKLLYQSNKATSESISFNDYEEKFLLGLDDYDDYLLDKAERYKAEAQKQLDLLHKENDFLRQALLNNKSIATPDDQSKLIEEIKEAVNPTLPDSENPSLDTLFEDWKSAKQNSIVNGSLTEYSRMIELFIRIVTDYNGGSVRINALNNDDIRHYRTTLAKIPKGIVTSKYTVSELITLKGNRKSPTTIKNTYSNVNTFLEWIAGEGHPIHSSVHKVLTKFDKIGKKDTKQRVPFTDAELKQLFNSEKYTETGKFTTSGMYWIGLISLFTGARMSEILQLEKHDIYQVDNIWVFNFDDSSHLSEDKHKHVKEAGSYREVPIHKTLIKLGFIDYINSIKGRLFPDEPRTEKGKFDAFQKRYATYRKQVGVIPEHEKQLKDFHSIRHTVRTRLSDIRTTGKANDRFDEGIIDAIVGHMSKDRSEGQKSYNHSQYIKTKNKALNRLTYDFIDFDSIIPWNKCKFIRQKYWK
ncbi:MAG: site-specific integrase [Methylococcales bacterium]